jgi:hypothetical protein
MLRLITPTDQPQKPVIDQPDTLQGNDSPARKWGRNERSDITKAMAEQSRQDKSSPLQQKCRITPLAKNTVDEGGTTIRVRKE